MVQSDGATLRDERLLESVQRIQLSVIDDAPEAEIYQQVLAVVMRTTHSEYGFVAEVFYEEDDTPFMMARAWTDIAWDSASRTFADSADERGLRFDNLDTLFGLSLVSGEMVISNHPETDPRRGGLPPGHPPLHAFMGLPIHDQGRMIGMIGLANRPGGYDKVLAESLSPLIVTCGSVIRFLKTEALRKRSEAELARHRDHLEELVEARAEKIARYERELAESRRMAFMGTLTAGLAHQINNPVGAILMTVQFALHQEGADDQNAIWRESLERVEDDAQRCGRIVKGLLDYSRNRPGALEPTCLRSVAHASVAACEEARRHNEAEVQVESDVERLPVIGNPIELQEVVTNVLMNAIQSRESNARVRVHLFREPPHAGVAIEDDGCGIEPEVRERAFEPFFTTRANGGGTGLGLSVVQGIVNAHGGRVAIEDGSLGGTRVVVRLPLRGG